MREHLEEEKWEYKAIESPTEEKINEMLLEGWQPVGPLQGGKFLLKKEKLQNVREILRG